MTQRIPVFVASVVLFAGLAGCATPPSPPAAAPVAAAAPAASQPAPAPPVAAPFADAVGRAGKKLFEDAAAQLGKYDRVLVVDPLVDASTGQQTLATSDMGRMLADVVRTSHPYWTVKDFNRATLASAPLLVIGTLTAINTRNDPAEAADAFRICLRLVDLQTRRVVAKGLARATGDSVNAEPVPLYRDSPTWHKDATVAAYIKSCQGTPNIGDSIDPGYAARLPAAAMLNEAQTAFGENRLNDALRLYQEVTPIADPDDLRVLNGLYLTSWRLGKRREAGEVFKKIAVRGISAKQLPLKVLFTPGKAAPIALPDLAAQYTLWLREVAQAAAAGSSCLRVIGHTSKSGTAALNDSLSAQRAAYVRDRLEHGTGSLRGRVASEGVGSRETLIGLGTDDLRDALDRRVEFRVVDCASVPKT